MMGKRFEGLHAIDVVIVAAIIAAGVIMMLLFMIPSGAATGEFAAVSNADGEILYPLGRDAEIVVSEKYHVTLVIKNGEAYIGHTECPGGDCARMGHISKVGGRIVCLPAGVIISVRGGTNGQSDDPDLVVG